MIFSDINKHKLILMIEIMIERNVTCYHVEGGFQFFCEIHVSQTAGGAHKNNSLRMNWFAFDSSWFKWTSRLFYCVHRTQNIFPYFCFPHYEQSSVEYKSKSNIYLFLGHGVDAVQTHWTSTLENIVELFQFSVGESCEQIQKNESWSQLKHFGDTSQDSFYRLIHLLRLIHW